MATNNQNDLVSAHQLAKLAGESYNTVDYWTERKALVCKRVGRRRFYGRKINLARIRLIRQRQSRGHSIEGILDEIRRQGL